MTTPPCALHVFISGRVHGVAFRWSTQRQARALGVHGWVRNLDDGRVEAWIEGAPDAVSSLREWMQSGPSAARVDALDVRAESCADHVTFEIRPDAHG